MAVTPLDIRTMTFASKMRGLDAEEVKEFLELTAEELTTRLGEIARLRQENEEQRHRLELAAMQQNTLQEALLQAQKLSQEITDSARRDAELLVKEAEITADTIVNQAIEQANKIESKLLELRTTRRDLQLKLKNTLDLFQRILEAEMDDEKRTATIRTLPRLHRRSS